MDFIKHGDRDGDTVARLTAEMEKAAERLDFENAARLRDRINAINKIKEKQKVVRATYKDEDIIASAVYRRDLPAPRYLFSEITALPDKKKFIIRRR